MEKGCASITGGTYFTPQGGENQATACDFTCAVGKVKKADSRRCDDPALGTYVDSNVQYNCFPPDSDSATDATAESAAELSQRGGTDWLATQPSTVTTRESCKLDGCVGDKVFTDSTKTLCRDLNFGHYKNTLHAEQSCSQSATDATALSNLGGTAWDTDQSGVRKATDCKLAGCSGSKVFKDSKKAVCINLPTDHYKKADHTSESCGTKPITSTGWSNDQSGVNQKSKCKFVCTTGRQPVGSGENGKCSIPDGYIATGNGTPSQCTNGKVANTAQSQCDAPRQGYFSKNGVETPCKGNPPATSTDWTSVQPSTVTSDTTCEFDCASGRTVSGVGGTGSCTLDRGYFATTTNDATPCGTAPDSSTDWSSSQSGVKQKSDCEFDCASGRTASSTKGSGGTCDINAGHVATGGPASDNPATLCTGGTVPNTGQDKCVNPSTGHYSKNGIETDCTVLDHGTFTANTVPLSTDNCPFTCNSNYGANAANTDCITCPTGEYLSKGVCTDVQGNYVSANNIITQKECTGNLIPKNDKSDCISNDCSSKIGDGTGILTVEGGTCQLTGCNAGFYEKNSSNSCTTVEANSGYYSGATSKGTKDCSDDVTKPDYASWTNLAGSNKVGDCTWACNTGYTIDSGGTGCKIHETLTKIELNSQDLKGISGSKNAIEKNVTSLRFTITASDVAWWYVTHIPPTTFNPKGKKTTDQGATEGDRSWTTTQPTSYPVSSFSTEREYRLYVWVADANQDVKLSSISSDPFTVDKTAPTGLSLSSEPNKEEDPGTTTASFTFSAVDTTDITYYYCTGSKTCTLTPVTGDSLSLTSLSHGSHILRYKAEDELGQATSVETFDWKILRCEKNIMETRDSGTTPAFAHGTQTRTCAGDGMSWGPLSVATCDGGFYRKDKINNDNTIKEGKTCVLVGKKSVSLQGDITATRCTDQTVPNGKKTKCVSCGAGLHTEKNVQCVPNIRALPKPCFY